MSLGTVCPYIEITRGIDKATVGYIHAPTKFYGAIETNAFEAASLLIQAGANVEMACVKSRPASLNYSAFKGLISDEPVMTPGESVMPDTASLNHSMLGAAILKKSVEAVRLLIE